MTDETNAPAATTASSSPKAGWLKRLAWVVAGILVGVLAMTPFVVSSDERADARDDARVIRSDARAAARDITDEAESAATIAVAKGEAQGDAMTKAAREENASIGDTNAALRKSVASLKRQVAAKQRELRSVTRQVNSNSIAGDGTYVVGVDIQPGTWRATAGEDCYWVKYNSGGDIIDNHIGAGPQVAVVSSSDFSFETTRCGAWRRSG